jgi:hypothetical protein
VTLARPAKRQAESPVGSNLRRDRDNLKLEET